MGEWKKTPKTCSIGVLLHALFTNETNNKQQENNKLKQQENTFYFILLHTNSHK